MSFIQTKISSLAKAMKTARAQKDLQEVARLLNKLGDTQRQAGQLEQAVKSHYEELQVVIELNPNLWCMDTAKALRFLGIVLGELDAVEHMVRCCDLHLRISRQEAERRQGLSVVDVSVLFGLFGKLIRASFTVR